MTTQDVYWLWYSRGHLIKGIREDHDDDLPRESVGSHLFGHHLGVHAMNRHDWSVGQTMCHEPPWLVGVPWADHVPWTAMVCQWGRPCAMNRHGWSVGQTMCHEPPLLVSGADPVPWTAVVGQWGRPCAMNRYDWSVGQTMCDATAGTPCYVLWILVLTTLGEETSHFQLLEDFFVYIFFITSPMPICIQIHTHTNATPHTILF